MKKILLVTIATVALTACSTNESPEAGNNPNVESGEKFLTLSVVSSRATRAAQYQDGTPTENAINRVRFYFFDEDGNPAPVKENKGTGNNSFNSYLDWYPTSTDQTTSNTPTNVEKVLSVTLGLDLPANLEEVEPGLVLAVLNPPAEVLALTATTTVQAGNSTLSITGPSLPTLRTTIGDYLTGMTAAGTFVMSNSVYVDKDGDLADATEIGEENWGTTEADAEKTPIIIYVERVLSRIDFLMALDSQANPSKNVTIDGSQKTIYKVGEYQVFTGAAGAATENIYVNLLGWNVTGTTSKSRLVKMINPSWTNTGLFGENSLEPWNSDNYFRSFWAVNPPNNDFEYQFGNFDGTGSTPGLFAQGKTLPTAENPTVTVYVQENANTYNLTNNQVAPQAPTYATNVIIAAQLVDANGNPYLMAEWNYYKYTLPQMKLKIAQALDNLYKRTGSDGAYTYTPVAPGDFTFATAYDLNMNDPDEPSYYVYPVLTTTAQGYTWTLGNQQNAPVQSWQNVNVYLRDMVNHVKVWENGMTYYFFTIQHLGEDGSPAYWGLVRNHIYNSTLVSIAGLGTPVYDPSETIYPERTEDDDNIVTALINILDWRLVKQEYNITWP